MALSPGHEGNITRHGTGCPAAAPDIVAGAAGARAFPARIPQALKKKEPPSPAARKYNREASNRVDRSHSMSRRWTLIVMAEKA
jgi:hypothetical protein